MSSLRHKIPDSEMLVFGDTPVSEACEACPRVSKICEIFKVAKSALKILEQRLLYRNSMLFCFINRIFAFRLSYLSVSHILSFPKSVEQIRIKASVIALCVIKFIVRLICRCRFFAFVFL